MGRPPSASARLSRPEPTNERAMTRKTSLHDDVRQSSSAKCAPTPLVRIVAVHKRNLLHPPPPSPVEPIPNQKSINHIVGFSDGCVEGKLSIGWWLRSWLRVHLFLISFSFLLLRPPSQALMAPSLYHPDQDIFNLDIFAIGFIGFPSGKALYRTKKKSQSFRFGSKAQLGDSRTSPRS